jgi:hypothetical protein
MNKLFILLAVFAATVLLSTGAAAQQKSDKAPAGQYGCVVVGGDEYFDIAKLTMNGDGSYEVTGSGKGKYIYSAKTGAITFPSGHYASKEVTGIYHAKGPVKGGIPGKTDSVIVLTPKHKVSSGTDHNDTQYCYKSQSVEQKKPESLIKSH